MRHCAACGACAAARCLRGMHVPVQPVQQRTGCAHAKHAQTITKDMVITCMPAHHTCLQVDAAFEYLRKSAAIDSPDFRYGERQAARCILPGAAVPGGLLAVPVPHFLRASDAHVDKL